MLTTTNAYAGAGLWLMPYWFGQAVCISPSQLVAVITVVKSGEISAEFYIFLSRNSAGTVA